MYLTRPDGNAKQDQPQFPQQPSQIVLGSSKTVYIFVPIVLCSVCGIRSSLPIALSYRIFFHFLGTGIMFRKFVYSTFVRNSFVF